ncbi:MAG: hypothetical protein U5N58_09395 [Actinomycetota bacterium]|nr:hypothetical protein [Actinomycetota bacterium]
MTDVFGGSQIRTRMGNCFLISTSEDFSLNCIDPGQAQDILLSDLKLIYGIGSITEQKLKDEGYKSIRDLVSHPGYGKQARQFLVYLEQKQPGQLTKWISRWCPCSHPHQLLVSSFCDQKNFLLLDIETMGLYNVPVMLHKGWPG